MNVESLQPYKLGKRSWGIVVSSVYKKNTCRRIVGATDIALVVTDWAITEVFAWSYLVVEIRVLQHLLKGELMTLKVKLSVVWLLTRRQMLTSTNQVLMRTATFTIQNTSGDKSLIACMILNMCNRDISKDLFLNLSPPEKLTMVTFGSEKPWHLQYKPSLLQSVLKDQKVMYLDISVAPSITGKIRKWKTQHLEFLKTSLAKRC